MALNGVRARTARHRTQDLGELRHTAARARSTRAGSLSKEGYALWWELTRLSFRGFAIALAG